jgi:hypothetical protein
VAGLSLAPLVVGQLLAGLAPGRGEATARDDEPAASRA